MLAATLAVGAAVLLRVPARSGWWGRCSSAWCPLAVAVGSRRRRRRFRVARRAARHVVRRSWPYGVHAVLDRRRRCSIFTNLAILGYPRGAGRASRTVVGYGRRALLVIRRLTALGDGRRCCRSSGWRRRWRSMHMSDLVFPVAAARAGRSTRTPVLVQIAELSGVHGVSFWIALTNGLVADAWLARRKAARQRDARRGDRRARVCAVAGVRRVADAHGRRCGRWGASASCSRTCRGREVGRAEPASRTSKCDRPRGSATRRNPTAPRRSSCVWPEAIARTTISTGIRRGRTAGATVSGHSRYAAAHRHARPAVRSAPGVRLFQRRDARGRRRARSDRSRLSQAAARADRGARALPRIPRWFAWAGQYFGGFGVGDGHQPSTTLPFGRFGVLVCYESIFPSRRARVPKRRRATFS